MLPKVAGWTSRSRKYTATEARNSTIRKITSTLNSGPDSSTSTRRNCRNPGIPGTTLSIQSTPEQPGGLGIGAEHERERHRDGGDGVHQPAAGQRVSPGRVAPEGVAKPDHPFEHEEGQARPQHRIDPVMRRLIGRIDREQDHHDDAGRHRDIGRLGHVAAGRCGHELRQSGEEQAAWTLGGGACRWKKT